MRIFCVSEDSDDGTTENGYFVRAETPEQAVAFWAAEMRGFTELVEFPIQLVCSEVPDTEGTAGIVEPAHVSWHTVE